MPSRKHNQYRNRITRQHGSSGMDHADKLKVKEILEKMNCTNVQFDQFLVIYPYDSHCSCAIFDYLTEEQARKARKIRHPDVTAEMDDGLIIVEIDGNYHADWDTDKDYDEQEIMYVKLNKEYLKKENISWEEWIKEELKYV